MSELEDREWKSLMLKRKKKKGDDDSLRDLWDNIKCTNSILGAPEGKEKERKGQRAYLGRSKFQEAQSSTQDQPKEECIKIYYN